MYGGDKMRRFLSIGTTLILTLSITACANANRNNAMNNNQNRTNTQNQQAGIQNQGNIGSPSSGSTNSQCAVGKYNNGIYVGQGIVTTTGNDAAIVTIRNGAIENIQLLSIDSSGKIQQTDNANFSSVTDPNVLNAPVPNGTGNDGGTGTTTPNVAGVPGSASTVPGTTIAQGTDKGLPDTVTKSTDGNNNNNANKNGIINSATHNNTNDATNNNAANNATTDGTTNNNNTNSLATAKKDLINNVLNSQTTDVGINVDESIKPIVNNWKTAIQDALNRATT
jgi:hypothetical protein